MLLNRLSKTIGVIFLVLGSCIEPFKPDLGESAADGYVVYGQVSDREGYQYVTISQASQVYDPEFKPLVGCQVTVLDDQGNTYSLQEQEGGRYRVWMDKAGLQPGTSYQLRVITPAGVEITSDYDKMPPGTPVDSVYFTLVPHPPDNPLEDVPGLQFYVDLEAGASDSRYYRWELTETWERHSSYPIEYWYDGRYHHTDPPDYSHMICWNTERIGDIYTLSTDNLSRNEYNGFELNFTGNNTSRLAVQYSLLVEQYAMSEAGFDYWDQLRINSSNQGGLYERQPLPVRGNLNAKGTGKQVLGTFNAVSISEKRIFAGDVPGLDLDYETFCAPPYFLMRGGIEASRGSARILYYLIIRGIIRPVDAACVDCLALGGTIVKPDFWPQ